MCVLVLVGGVRGYAALDSVGRGFLKDGQQSEADIHEADRVYDQHFLLHQAETLHEHGGCRPCTPRDCQCCDAQSHRATTNSSGVERMRTRAAIAAAHIHNTKRVQTFARSLNTHSLSRTLLTLTYSIYTHSLTHSRTLTLGADSHCTQKEERQVKHVPEHENNGNAGQQHHGKHAVAKNTDRLVKVDALLTHQVEQHKNTCTAKSAKSVDVAKVELATLWSAEGGNHLCECE
jgi:hypothetical protein